MNGLVVAVSFLTRLPVSSHIAVRPSDIARSAAFFPVVGAALGALCCLAAALLKGHVPPFLVATVIVLLDVLLTGALHFDGLADTADGFGGARSRDDVLRIMHDHSIGSFGGVALAVCVAFKVAAYAALVSQGHWISTIIMTPALGRWSTLLVTAMYQYAGSGQSVTDGIGKRALALGTVAIVVLLAFVASIRALIAVIAVAFVTTCFGFYCRKRVGGFTGDTLGANVQLNECAALLVALWK